MTAIDTGASRARPLLPTVNPDDHPKGCGRIHGMLQDIDGCQLKEATENGLHQRIDWLQSLISEQQRRAR